MTQIEERERILDRPVREPPVRKAPPPKVPHPPHVGLPIRWIGWAAVLVVLAGVGVVAWLAFAPSGSEEAVVGDLFTQQREAGVEYSQPDPVYTGDLFTQQREAGVEYTVRPDEAMSGLIVPAIPSGHPSGTVPVPAPAPADSVGFRWAGLSGGVLEEHLLTLQPDEAASGLIGSVLRGEDPGAVPGGSPFRWVGESGPTLEEMEAGS